MHGVFGFNGIRKLHPIRNAPCTVLMANMGMAIHVDDIRIVQLKMAVQGLVRGHAFIVPRRNQASGEPTRGDSGSNPDTCPCFHVEYHTARSSRGSAITSEGVQAYQNKPTGSGVRGGISLERSMELCSAKFSSQAVGVGSHTKGNPLSS